MFVDFVKVFTHHKSFGPLTLLSDHKKIESPVIHQGDPPLFNTFVDGQFLPGNWNLARIIDKHHLLIGRDAIGVKPMYYLHTKEYFAFATTIAPLLKIKSSDEVAQDQILYWLLFGRQEEEGNTLFSKIKELLPSQKLTLNLSTGEINLDRIFTKKDLIPLKKRNSKSEDLRLIRQHLTNQIINKGNFGHALLSGGVDSGVLNAIIANVSEHVHHAYTAGFPQESYDESKMVKTFIRKYPKTNSIICVPSGQGFLDHVEQLHRTIELPTLSAGSYLQFALMKTAQEHGAKYMVDGTGADALFAGHYHYPFHLMNSYLARLQFAKFSSYLRPNKRLTDLKNYSKYKLKTEWLPHLTKSIANAIEKRKFREWKIINPDFLEANLPYLEKTEHEFLSLDKLLEVDFFNGGVRRLLRFPERCARAFDIELICPYVSSVELIKLLFSITAKDKYLPQRSKYLLREACRDILPKSYYEPKPKMGLVSPNNRWMSEYKDKWKSYLLDPSMATFYNLPYLEKNFDHFFDIREQPENYRIFKYLSFAIWHQVMVVN